MLEDPRRAAGFAVAPLCPTKTSCCHASLRSPSPRKGSGGCRCRRRCRRPWRRRHHIRRHRCRSRSRSPKVILDLRLELQRHGGGGGSDTDFMCTWAEIQCFEQFGYGPKSERVFGPIEERSTALDDLRTNQLNSRRRWHRAARTRWKAHGWRQRSGVCGQSWTAPGKLKVGITRLKDEAVATYSGPHGAEVRDTAWRRAVVPTCRQHASAVAATAAGGGEQGGGVVGAGRLHSAAATTSTPLSTLRRGAAPFVSQERCAPLSDAATRVLFETASDVGGDHSWQQEVARVAAPEEGACSRVKQRAAPLLRHGRATPRLKVYGGVLDVAAAAALQGVAGRRRRLPGPALRHQQPVRQPLTRAAGMWAPLHVARQCHPLLLRVCRYGDRLVLQPRDAHLEFASCNADVAVRQVHASSALTRCCAAATSVPSAVYALCGAASAAGWPVRKCASTRAPSTFNCNLTFGVSPGRLGNSPVFKDP
ncbi:hypothetical protein JKP88DRAFT_251454 [Tribonema minus]|uniref:Uncharacterized protein n=1 Tax=Tribonema minus TaxID=303371 RepID=A0A835ZEI0_9STRA|nr:hypothetical protein JKP88DRAFT_251454 [Tribonema minus]